MAASFDGRCPKLGQSRHIAGVSGQIAAAAESDVTGYRQEGRRRPRPELPEGGAARRFTRATQTITVLVEESPHRVGSDRYKRWPKYPTGMTVAEALKAGFNYANLRFSVADGHIAIPLARLAGA